MNRWNKVSQVYTHTVSLLETSGLEQPGKRENEDVSQSGSIAVKVSLFIKSHLLLTCMSLNVNSNILASSVDILESIVKNTSILANKCISSLKELSTVACLISSA